MPPRRGAGRLDAARAFHERIYPLARAVYRLAPGGRTNARLKTCLALLGHFPCDRVLPPAIVTPPPGRTPAPRSGVRRGPRLVPLNRARGAR